MASLNNVSIGSSAVVRMVTTDDPLKSRLLDLGIVPGTVIKAVRRSPVGDPTAYLIRNTLIALRQEEAQKILVSPVVY